MNRRKFIKYGAASSLPFFLPSTLMANGSLDVLQRSAFGDDFLWGVATSAYQIEGAWNLHGKGASIWDTYSHDPKKIKDGTNGDVSCDFYHNYESDLELLKTLGFKVFRFSISWTRIFPRGTGSSNAAGIEFYHKVIDKCLELDIEPWITCYHWDLPQALPERRRLDESGDRRLVLGLCRSDLT